MTSASLKSKAGFWLYRISTVCKSVKTLYTLSPEKIQAFLDSYQVYNHDWANEEELIQKMGQNYYQQMKSKIIDWYSVLNHLCAVGQIEKMYIPPALDLSQNIIANQTLLERKISQDLGLKKGHRILDIGCGRGRVAHHIASISGAHVTGINIDSGQLESAQKFAMGTGMQDQCQFQMWDLNEIPYSFADSSFDHIYQIQVFSLAKDLKKLFKELHRLLKPGGKLAFLEWVRFDKYDPKNAHHISLMRKIKPLIGAIGTLSPQEYKDLLEKAGFEVLISKEPSIGGHQAPLIEKADRFFTKVAWLIKWLVKCRLLPAHFKLLFDRLTQDGAALIEADKLGLVTTSYYILAQKK